MSRESQLQAQLLLAAPSAIPNLRLFRRNVGVARMRGAVVQFAIAGQSDLYGLVRGGRHIEVELKAASAPRNLPADQESWANWCVAWGIPHVVLRASKDESDEQTVARWCEELRRLTA